jgi:hypothetical protein
MENRDKFYDYEYMLIICLSDQIVVYNINEDLEYKMIVENIEKGGLIVNCIEVSGGRIFLGGN